MRRQQTRAVYVLFVRLAHIPSLLVLFAAACSAAPAPPAASPDPVPAPAPAPSTEARDGAAAPSPPPAAPTMPTACARTDDPGVCPLPGPFVDALCNGSFPDATLALFAKGSPWVRGYLRGDVDGWYAGGGSARARLAFDEEVLVLRVRKPPAGGVVVGNGAATYDVARFDGFCYTLDQGELTMKRPPKPRHATVPFHRLSEPTQTALLKDEKVKAARARRGKECKGAMTGDVSLACEKADHALGEAVADVVTSGAALPAPERIPGG